MRHALVLALSLLVTPTAFASEVAYISRLLSPESDEPVDQPADSGGRLSRADASTLYPGQIPSFVNYDTRMMNNRDRCGLAWRTLRNSNVTVRPIAARLDTIRRNARAAGISPDQLNRTLATYLKNQDGIPNQRFVTLIDFSKRSDQKRLFTIDLEKGGVTGFPTSAGDGSDPRGTGYASVFSNRVGRGHTSLGCYMVYGTYSGGKFGKDNTMMLHGFEPTNDNACARSLIFHPRSYVGQVPGRSNGCFAVRPTDQKTVFPRVSGGLVCAYGGAGATQVAETRAKPRRSRAKHKFRRAHVARHSWRYSNDL